jgi:hypothetical protein
MIHFEETTLIDAPVIKNSKWVHDKEPFGYWLTIAFECGLFVWLFGLFILGIA